MRGSEARQLRKILNLSQSQLGKKLGVTPSAISKWEGQLDKTVTNRVEIQLCGLSRNQLEESMPTKMDDETLKRWGMLRGIAKHRDESDESFRARVASVRRKPFGNLKNL